MDIYSIRPIKQCIVVYSRQHSCGIHTVCVEVGMLGCGVLNCLEETWEERGYRERKEEGGRAQYAVGIF